jgi:hypothetical protein
MRQDEQKNAENQYPLSTQDHMPVKIWLFPGGDRARVGQYENKKLVGDDDASPDRRRM